MKATNLTGKEKNKLLLVENFKAIDQ